MECWYDSLFECDCEGIYEILRVPCAGSVNTTANYRQPWGLMTPLGETLDPKLNKRIKWITSCASVASFFLIVLDDWKTKMFRVFIEVLAIRVWPDPKQPWYWIVQDLTPHHCYYLGQYPWYWDYNYYCTKSPDGRLIVPPQTEAVKKILASPGFAPARTFVYSPKVIVFGVETGGGRWVEKKNILPFGMTPSYPDVEYDLYKTREEEENRFFLGDPIVNTWNEQLAVIDFINNRFTNCLARLYPPPDKIPKGVVRTKDGDFQWPGKPLDQIQRPLPEPSKYLPPEMTQTKISIITTLAFSPAGRPDGLTLETTLY